MAHPNVDKLQMFLDAYAARDRDALAQSLSTDAVWHVGGTHRLSGDYHGSAALSGRVEIEGSGFGTERGRGVGRGCGRADHPVE